MHEFVHNKALHDHHVAGSLGLSMDIEVFPSWTFPQVCEVSLGQRKRYVGHLKVLGETRPPTARRQLAQHLPEGVAFAVHDGGLPMIKVWWLSGSTPRSSRLTSFRRQ